MPLQFSHDQSFQMVIQAANFIQNAIKTCVVSGEAQLRGSEGEFDGFEGGFDAIIVEMDWDSPALSGRSKRQSGFSSGS